MEGNKHVIFDFFGTLVRYEHGPLSGDRYLATHQFLQKNNYLISYKDFEASFFKVFNRLEEQAKITNEEFSMLDLASNFFQTNFKTVPNKKTLAQFIEVYHSEWNRHIFYYPQIKQFLKKLSKRYTLSIITNTHYKPLVLTHLQRMGILSYFKLILTSVEYGKRKPDMRIFKKALKHLSANPKHSIFIGDSFEADYQGALSMGMRSVLIDPSGKFKGVVKDRVDNLFDISL